MKIETFVCEINNASFEQMIAAGYYEKVDYYIKAFEPFAQVSACEPKKVKFCLVSFPYDVYRTDAISEISEMGLRPANITELLAFGTKSEEFLREIGERYIVCLGSVLKFNDQSFIAFLGRTVDGHVEHVLGVDLRDNGYFDTCCHSFLAVRD